MQTQIVKSVLGSALLFMFKDSIQQRTKAVLATLAGSQCVN